MSLPAFPQSGNQCLQQEEMQESCCTSLCCLAHKNNQSLQGQLSNLTAFGRSVETSWRPNRTESPINTEEIGRTHGVHTPTAGVRTPVLSNCTGPLCNLEKALPLLDICFGHLNWLTKWGPSGNFCFSLMRSLHLLLYYQLIPAML